MFDDSARRTRIARVRRLRWFAIPSLVLVLCGLTVVGSPRAAEASGLLVPPVPSTQELQIPNESVLWCESQIADGNNAACVNWPVPPIGTNCYDPCGNYAQCSGGGCTGKDPGQQGCGYDATTNQDLYFTNLFGYVNYYVDNRWSHNCQANWTRVWDDNPNFWKNNCGCGPPPSMTAYVYYGNGQAPSYSYANSSSVGTIWTLMLNGAAGTPCTVSKGYVNYHSGITRCF